jgi:hypothetical protein
MVWVFKIEEAEASAAGIEEAESILDNRRIVNGEACRLRSLKYQLVVICHRGGI